MEWNACYKNSARKTHKKTICLDKNNSISSFSRISFRIELDDGRMVFDDRRTVMHSSIHSLDCIAKGNDNSIVQDIHLTFIHARFKVSGLVEHRYCITLNETISI